MNMLETRSLGKWFEVTIPESWNGVTLEEIFRSKWKVPKKLTHSFRTEKKALINGKPANWNVSLSAGTKLGLLLFEEVPFETEPSYLDVPVIYEDDHLIVFNKPPFISTHPNEPDETDTLANAAAFYMLSKGEIRNIRHIHRLDRDTSGAIIFSKHSLAGSLMDMMLEKREIKRTYLALVQGQLHQKKGIINEPIGRDRHHPVRRRVSATGQDAITHYQVLKGHSSQKLTAIKCWLDTGRTHQIRVHFSHIGHPLAGDILYGGLPLFDRQALHAAKLEFIHPLTLEKIVCYAPFLDKPPIFSGINLEDI